MPDDAAVATIAAAVETILPPVDDFPGAAALDVHRHVVEVMEMAVPGFTDLLAMLLDAYAADVSPDRSFVDLDRDGRDAALRAMAAESSQDMTDAVGALLLFAYGGTYSEWSGYDRGDRSLRRPPVWDEIGYLGPSRGHPEYREGGPREEPPKDRP